MDCYLAAVPLRSSDWKLRRVPILAEAILRLLGAVTAAVMPEWREGAAQVEPVPGVNEIQDALGKLFVDPDDRVKAAAALAFGKIGQRPTQFRPVGEMGYYAPLFDLLRSNSDKDPYLRHAAVMGLVHVARNPIDVFNAWTVAKEQAKDKYDVAPVRLGVALALRKHKSDKVAAFLTDPDAKVVAEAARAVCDERIGGAMPELAKVAEKPGMPDAISYRALAANYHLGTPDAASRVAASRSRDFAPGFASCTSRWPFRSRSSTCSKSWSATPVA